MEETKAPATPLRVLLADDHDALREAVRALIDFEQDMDTVAEAADGAQAIELAKEHKPDVAVIDVNMPRIDGAEATRQIKASLPDTFVICLSIHPDAEMAQALKDAGADEYITKGGRGEELIDAIRKARERA